MRSPLVPKGWRVLPYSLLPTPHIALSDTPCYHTKHESRGNVVSRAATPIEGYPHVHTYGNTGIGAV